MKTYTKQDAINKKQVWWSGKKVVFTGKVDILYGGLFGVAKVIKTNKTVHIALKEA